MTALLNDPQWQAFLAAIRANLADDTARLVAADWLDENAGTLACERCEGGGLPTGLRKKMGRETCGRCSGSGRVSNGFAEFAEFVRIQVEIARIFPGTACVQCGRKSWERPNVKYCGDGSNKDYSHRYEISEERKLLEKRAEELWVPPTSRSVSKSAHTVGLATVILDGQPQPGSVYRSWGIARRGFIDETHCRMDQWLAHGPQIVRLPTAVVRKVRVTDREPGLYANTKQWYWVLWTDDVTYPVTTLPAEIFDLMIGDPHTSQLGSVTKHYATRDLAHTALSDACLSWAWASEPAVNVA